MLFQQLYNWIKYKTLPSSFLFKNRLYIERDSKHKRMFSNFGLSFRNSKWGSHDNSNIKSNFRLNYVMSVFNTLIFFFIGYLCTYFYSSYTYCFPLSNISFIFWAGIDTFDYYFSFGLWALSIVCSSFFNFIYSFFFDNHFREIKINNTPDMKKSLIDKHDLNWLLYIWLNNDSHNKNAVLDILFNCKVNQEWWNRYHDFFPKLFKLTYYLSLVNKKTSFYSCKIRINNILKVDESNSDIRTLTFLNSSINLTNSFNMCYYYLISRGQSYGETKNSNSTVFLSINTKWNLNSLDVELKNYSFLLKSKVGLFFCGSLNYQKLLVLTSNYSEAWNLNFFLKNQLNVSKWNRWLYKYSILHRKILKNSHKVTLSKRLIGNGFFNNFSFNKNIWVSKFLNKADSKTSISSIYNLNYNHLFSSNHCGHSTFYLLNSNNYNESNSLDLLSFYEKSYFWFIKRFYFFNTLKSNFIKSSCRQNNSNLNRIISTSNENLNTIKQYHILLSYLLNSFSFNILFFLNSKQKSQPAFTITTKAGLAVKSKDIYLELNANNLLNRDNLNILYWTSTNSSFLVDQINFFQATPVMQLKLDNKNLIFLSDAISIEYTKEVTLFNILSLLNVDNVFTTDVNYLSRFY